MTHHLTSVLAVAFAGVLATGSASCNAVECGDGTIEKDGVCVTTDVDPGDAQCGAGTKLGLDGTCIPEREVVCDPDTTDEVIDPVTGVVTCMGSGGVGDCMDELPCSTPTDGKITICGRLRDIETDMPFQANGATGAACDPLAPTATGPCSLELTFVDALEFAGDPTGATPHIPASFTLDDCGRYRAVDLELSNNGYTGIAIDDATGDNFKLTGVALEDADAKPARGFTGYVTTNATDTAWHTTSGIGGLSFTTRGVIAMVFRHNAIPMSGVQIRRSNNPITADDYYFSDPSTTTRSTVAAAQALTGTNGSVLALHPGFTSVSNYSGLGGEPGACVWPTALAAAIPGVVFAQIKHAETTGGSVCPP